MYCFDTGFPAADCFAAVFSAPDAAYCLTAGFPAAGCVAAGLGLSGKKGVFRAWMVFGAASLALLQLA